MRTTDKMLNMLAEMNRQPIKFIKSDTEKPNYRLLSLMASQTLPNQSVQELLENARKIEWWLREPERNREEFRREMEKAFMPQKSPVD